MRARTIAGAIERGGGRRGGVPQPPSGRATTTTTTLIRRLKSGTAAGATPGHPHPVRSCSQLQNGAPLFSWGRGPGGATPTRHHHDLQTRFKGQAPGEHDHGALPGGLRKSLAVATHPPIPPAPVVFVRFLTSFWAVCGFCSGARFFLGAAAMRDPVDWGECRWCRRHCLFQDAYVQDGTHGTFANSQLAHVAKEPRSAGGLAACRVVGANPPSTVSPNLSPGTLGRQRPPQSRGPLARRLRECQLPMFG